MPFLLIVAGLAFAAYSLRRASRPALGPALSVTNAGDIRITRFANGYGRIESPRCACVARGQAGVNTIVEIERGTRAACEADLRSLG